MDKAESQRLATVAAFMRELRASSEWACYADALRAMMNSEVEAVLQASPSNFEYRKGRVHALRDALALPDTLIARSRHG